MHEGMEQAVKERKDLSNVPNVNRPSNHQGRGLFLSSIFFFFFFCLFAEEGTPAFIFYFGWSLSNIPSQGAGDRVMRMDGSLPLTPH